MTTPTSFHPGQVVQLKSGGPRMTVLLHDEPSVWLCWFDDTCLMRDCFPPSALVLAPELTPEGANDLMRSMFGASSPQPSPLNSLCTGLFHPTDPSTRRMASELQVVISSLTGLPINITWVPSPVDPDGLSGWFEVSAPLKP